MKIVITIEVPEGVQIAVSQPNGHESTYVPPFADELVPLPEGAIPLPGDTAAQPASARRGIAVLDPNVCPVHHLAWKVVPAGVSKKTGNTYAAFRACPERGCDQRPA